MARSTAPRSWRYRESLGRGPEGSYHAVCGHYLAAGTYACQDCNLAPLSDWLALREALIEVTDCLQATGRSKHDKRAEGAINRARKLLEDLD